jgi:hypothetical protein
MNRIDRAVLFSVILIIIPGAIPLAIIGILISKIRRWTWGK